jgi:arylsulfatase A-like enzyme
VTRIELRSGDCIIPRNPATIGEILKENGYATSWFGKDHNTPAFQASQAGPFEQWSAGMGFEYFYGFVGGDTSQWQPNLFRNTTAIYPYVGKPGWNLTTATADDATWLNQLNAILLLLCAARRHPCAASPDTRMDREVQWQVRHGPERFARSDFSSTRKSSASYRKTRSSSPRSKDLLPEWNPLNAGPRLLRRSR